MHTKKQKVRVFFSYLTMVALVFSLLAPMATVKAEAANETQDNSVVSTDIQGHWAEEKISDWISKGLANGYGDGTFKPNNNIKRAEFVTLVNKAFNLTDKVSIDFTDVKSSDWFYDEIAKAKKAGYVSGYEDGSFRPNNPINRQEVAVIIFRLLELDEPENYDALGKFSDAGLIPDWSKDAIATLVEEGLMSGYPDNSFKPQNATTRAESIVVLDNVVVSQAEDIEETEELEEEESTTSSRHSGGSSSNDDDDDDDDSPSQVTYSTAGTYGPETGTQTIKKDVTLAADGIILRNTIVEGNLTISGAVGDGDVTLKNVEVTGETTVNGGGENSIHFEDSTLLTVIVNKNNGTVRIVAEGSTSVQEVQIQSSVIVQEENLAEGASGFTNVTVDEQAANADIEISSTLDTVNVFAANVRINTSSSTSIRDLILNAVAQVLGEAHIQRASIAANASGSSLASAPTETLTIGHGARANVGGVEMDESDSTGFVATLESIDTTLGSIAIDIDYIPLGLTESDFSVTAAVYSDSVGTVYPIQDIDYDSTTNRITFEPVRYDNNIGKEFVVTVAPAEGSALVGGEAQTDTVTIDYGFEGRITNIYGDSVEGMTIKFREDATTTEGDVVATATTDEYGYYSVSLEPGMYSGELEKDGFLTTYIVATSLSDYYNVGQNETAIIAANDDEIKIVLTWGQNPRDLDSHLLGPTPNGSDFHTWYSDKEYDFNGETYVDLDWDDTQSYGPETTTIRKVLDGTYRFYVHHFSGSNTISTSGAKIEVYKGENLLKTYEAPTDGGSSIYWLAFDMNIDGDNISFVDINAMGNVEPSLAANVIQPSNVTITNNIGSDDIVEVTGLREGDVVKLYDQAESDEPFATSIQVGQGDDTITFTGLDLGVEAGQIWVSATNELYQEDESAKVVVEYSAESTLGTVAGYVYDENNDPINGVVIDIAGFGNDSDAVTDASGEFTISNVEAGNYTVTATVDGFEEAQKTVDVGAGQTSNVSFELTATSEPPETSGTVVGYVYNNADNTPIQGAVIDIAGFGDDSDAVTDASGAFTISDVAAGDDYTVTATADGYQEAQRTVDVVAGQTSNVSFELTATSTTPEEPESETVINAVYTAHSIGSELIGPLDEDNSISSSVDDDYLVVTFSDSIDGDVVNIVDIFGTEDPTVTNTVYGTVYDEVYSTVYNDVYLYIGIDSLNIVEGTNTITVSNQEEDTTVIFTVYGEE